ncbi:MAG: hypothetical protein GY800_09600 [Planctomycetes bacterium]|nr:hypothetical protein [Planctomycetota bacterium]
MNRTTFLPVFMLFLSCGTGLPDVVTLYVESIFEGELTKKEGKWNEIMDEGFALADENPDMSDETMVGVLGKRFDVPPIIVDMIYYKWFRMW